MSPAANSVFGASNAIMVPGVNSILLGGHLLDDAFRYTAAVNVEIFGATECELTDCVIMMWRVRAPPSGGLYAGLLMHADGVHAPPYSCADILFP